VSSKNAGLGLGLAVCRTIVHAHDGRLWAENNAGAGATLHLELRAAPANAGA
jgi:two-component system sensor kinase FixL